MQERTVSQPTRITFACFRRLDNVFGKDHLSRRRVFFAARGRFTGLHSTPCVVESIFENTYHRRVKCPVSVLLDEAPHRLTRAFNVGGSDQPSPLLPSLLRPAMVVTIHPCSLRDHDTGEPTLCISVTERPIICALRETSDHLRRLRYIAFKNTSKDSRRVKRWQRGSFQQPIGYMRLIARR
jgi:hypothetical protein